MREGIDGFATLEDAADAIAAYNPNRPRPKDLSGLRKNLRERARPVVLALGPRFMQGRDGVDGQAGLVDHDRLAAAAAGSAAHAARAGPDERHRQRGERAGAARSSSPTPR